MARSRRFEHHRVRRVVSLDGCWRLRVPRDGATIEPLDEASGEERDFFVPGVWETLLGMENYRGQAVARRTFEVAEAGAARLVFKGVSHTARVFVDGVEVGGHHNAFTAFAVDLPRLEAGEHELRVHITNEHGDASALHVPNDYYNYGGINRPVELQRLNGSAYLGRVHVTPRREADRWVAGVEAEVVNLGGPIDGEVAVELAGRRLSLGGAMGEGATQLSGEMSFEGVEPWSPGSPTLYMIDATLSVDGRVVDDWRDRTGFRTVEVAGGRLLLNGEPVFFVGFNRHEDHAEYGCALPESAQAQDIAMFKDLGANALRTSHYPNDERTLDLCDERGLMVWEENHARGLNLEQMQHPRFDDQCRDCIAEMIEQHYNHPSIVLWGILNECASQTEAGRAKYAAQFEQIKSRDQSRPTTFASCCHGTDICQDLPDVAGWNWYPNWYGQAGAGDRIGHHLAWLAGTPANDKPIICSETGAGAIPGFRDPRRRAKWSEERQVELIEELLDPLLGHERLSGVFLWQFCDVRVDEAVARGRPRTMNNKGVVDEYRRPKLSYEAVKRRFRAFTDGGGAGSVNRRES